MATASRFVVIVSLAACVTVSAPASGQSLADAARKSEEESAKAKQDQSKSGETRKAGKPAKVYTNKDLSDAPAPTPPTAANGVTSDIRTDVKTDPVKSSAPATPATDAKEPAKGEAYWRGRVTPLQAKLAGVVAKRVAVDRRIDDLTTEMRGIGPLNARRGGVESERQRLITESGQLGIETKGIKAEIAAIEEEGRRAGALPGWFR